MVLSWRLRRRAKNGNTKISTELSDKEILIPTHFRCPISLDLMKDPVTLCTGITYDRESLEKWLEEGNQTCPVTNQVLLSFDQIPNHSIRKMIQDWCVENRSHGIERIPTPRIPVSPYEISEICKRITVATQHGDQKKCQELVGKIKNWGKESERNKRRIVENGVGCVLSACFESFSGDKHVGLLEEILSVLVWMFPFGVESQTKLGSSRSLQCLVRLLKSGDLSATQNAVLVLKELLCLDQQHVNALAEVEGVVEALMKLIKEPICPTVTKASLVAIFYLTSPNQSEKKRIMMISTFVEMGLVSLIIEILVDGDKGICEKALGVLDRICDSKEGREKAHDNDLIVPVLIKKILRVSNLASEFSVSILWKLCKNRDEKKDHDDDGVIVEALQVGAFHKLLVLLQVGCDDNTKEKVKELFKLFNLYKARLDCVDSSMDFKHVKKPY